MQALFLNLGPIWQIHPHSGTKAYENILLILLAKKRSFWVFSYFIDGGQKAGSSTISWTEGYNNGDTLTYIILPGIKMIALAMKFITFLLQLLDSCWINKILTQWLSYKARTGTSSFLKNPWKCSWDFSKQIKLLWTVNNIQTAVTKLSLFSFKFRNCDCVWELTCLKWKKHTASV